jgi:hypothetical protein
MKVFISHSGLRSSKVAGVLKEWLPNVIQAIEPWISDDIKKGKIWRQSITKELEETKIGIICLTQTNLNAPWLLFEAGALSKTQDAIVCTYLLDNEPSDISGPLSDFQHTIFDKEDIRKLLATINDQLKNSNERSVDESRLNTAFETYWPEFEKKITAIKTLKEGSESISRTKRKQEDILNEVLERVRRLETSGDSAGNFPSKRIIELKNEMEKQEFKKPVAIEDYLMMNERLKTETSKLEEMRQTDLSRNLLDNQIRLVERLKENVSNIESHLLRQQSGFSRRRLPGE